MKRVIFFLTVLLLGTQAVFIFSQATVPLSLRDNQFLYESLRLNNLARLAFDDGDYEASTAYAEEAILYAAYSDEYVLMRLKMMDADNAINNARQRIEYVASLNAATRFPTEYNRAQTAYNDARAYRLAENWDNAIAAANQAIAALAAIDFTVPPVPSVPPVLPPAPGGGSTLPAQYTVRSWELFRDCLWNIAGWSWVYNDPTKWPILFEANRSAMPDFNNPDLIHPGMILNIPSIGGEARQGMWQSGVNYPSF